MESVRHVPRWVAPLVTGCIASVAVLALTPSGAGLTNDSVSYVGTAMNVADGKGVTAPFVNTLDPITPLEAVAHDGRIPLVLWPPVYPALLGTLAALGLHPGDGARLLHGLAIAVTAASTSVLARRLAGGREAAAWLAPPLALASAPLLSLHLFVLTEPLALAVGTTALALLAACVERQTGWRVTALALLAATAPLVRVTGVTIPLVAGLALAFWGSSERRTRLEHALIVAGAGLVPFAAWIMWARLQTEAPVRPVAWHPPPWVRYDEALARAVEWVVPASAPSALRMLAVVVVIAAPAAAAFMDTRRGATSPRLGPAGRAALAVGAFAVVHTLVVVASSALLQEQLPIGGRLMVPVLPPLTVLVVACGVRLAETARSTDTTLDRVATGAMIAAALLCAGALAADAHDRLAGARLDWSVGPTTDLQHQIAALPPTTVVLSNAPGRVWLETGRPSLVVPRTALDGAGEPHPRFDREVAEVQDLASCRETVFVLYDDVAFFTPYVATPEQVRSMVDLEEAVIEGPATLLVPTAEQRRACTSSVAEGSDPAARPPTLGGTDDGDDAVVARFPEGTTSLGPLPSTPVQATGEPVRIGVIDTDGDVAAPEGSHRGGAEAAVALLNGELGGIASRPLALLSCAVDGSPASTRRCARQMIGGDVEAVLLGTDPSSHAAVALLNEAGVPILDAAPDDLDALRADGAVLSTAGLPGIAAAQAGHAVDAGAQHAVVVHSDYRPLAFAAVEVGAALFEGNGLAVDLARVPVGSGRLDTLQRLLQDDSVDTVLVSVFDDLCDAVVRLVTERRPDVLLLLPPSCATPAAGSRSALTGTRILTALQTVPATPDDLATNLLGMGRVDPRLYVAAVARYGEEGLVAHGATERGFRAVMDAAWLLRASAQMNEPSPLLDLARQVEARPLFSAATARCPDQRRGAAHLVAACAPQVLVVALGAEGVTDLADAKWTDSSELLDILRSL